MSYLPINSQDEEEAPGMGVQGSAEAPPQAGGSVGEEAAGAGPAKGSSTASPTQFGSSASKLGDYLSANAPQIDQQAGTIAENLNTQYGNLNKGITDAAGQFQGQIQGGYAANNPNAVNQAMADPTKFASNAQNIKDFQGQYNNAYTGPANFEGTGGYSDIQGKVGEAVKQGNLLGNQAGLQSYLQGKGPNPTKASSTLDALLLRGNPEAQQKIQAAAGQFGNLTGQLETAATSANQSVQNAQKAAQASKDYAQEQFSPYVQKFGNDLTTNAANAETGRTAYNTNQLKTYNELTPIQQWIQQYQGGTAQTLDNPLTQYLNQTPAINPITPQNYSTPEQYAQAQAIQQLSGNNVNLPIGQDTVGLAGTASAVPTNGQYDINEMIRSLGSQATQKSWDALPRGPITTPTSVQSGFDAGSDFWRSYGAGSRNPAYQSFMNQLRSRSPENFSQLKYKGKVVEPNNYYFGQQPNLVT